MASQASSRPPPSPLPERARNLLLERLEQILQHGALVGLDEGLGRHSGDEANVLEARHLVRGQRDADRVVGLAGCAEFCCSRVRSAEMRVSTPVTSGVVRWLPAMIRTITLAPGAIWSMSCGATLASTTSSSARGTICMMISPLPITPPTVAPKAGERCPIAAPADRRA